MRAADYFQNGYSCSESIIKWGVEQGLITEEFLPIATSFSGGMGSGCLCGAIAGSQIILGYQFGRDNKNGNDNIARAKAKEFIQKFTEKHKATCCRVLTRGLEMASPERKAHCTNMVDDCQKLIEELISVKVS